MKLKTIYLTAAITLILGCGACAWLWPTLGWVLLVAGSVVALGIWDLVQRRHSILRTYPVVGHIRFVLETIRPELRQYFVESDTDGTPFSRERQTIVYERAKNVEDVEPFGTELDLYANRAEWVNHSIRPANRLSEEPRVQVGLASGRPYLASRLNISAMSFGSLSANAILALNHGGARIGGSLTTRERVERGLHLSSSPIRSVRRWTRAFSWFAMRSSAAASSHGFESRQVGRS